MGETQPIEKNCCTRQESSEEGRESVITNSEEKEIFITFHFKLFFFNFHVSFSKLEVGDIKGYVIIGDETCLSFKRTCFLLEISLLQKCSLKKKIPFGSRKSIGK